jgi:hypothetical protein
VLCPLESQRQSPGGKKLLPFSERGSRRRHLGRRARHTKVRNQRDAAGHSDRRTDRPHEIREPAGPPPEHAAGQRPRPAGGLGDAQALLQRPGGTDRAARSLQCAMRATLPAARCPRRAARSDIALLATRCARLDARAATRAARHDGHGRDLFCIRTRHLHCDGILCIWA